MITVWNLIKVKLIDKITILEWTEKIKKFHITIKSIKLRKKTELNTFLNQVKNRVKNLKI
jgi:aryl carrier-like protein